MSKTESKRLITVNLAFWAVAMLVHPLARLLPTGSGSPPKIFEVLIPIFFIMLAGGSTFLLKAAIGARKDD